MRRRKISEKELLMEELENAHIELEIARNQFDNAEPDFVEIAADRLRIAELNLNLVHKKAKMLDIPEFV